MEAVIKGAKTVLSYSQPGDSILLLVDSKVVFSWLKQLFNDEKVSVSGLYAVLVDRRLNIIKALFEDRNVTVEWIASELNPADCLPAFQMGGMLSTPQQPSLWEVPLSVLQADVDRCAVCSIKNARRHRWSSTGTSYQRGTEKIGELKGNGGRFRLQQTVSETVCF